MDFSKFKREDWIIIALIVFGFLYIFAQAYRGAIR